MTLPNPPSRQVKSPTILALALVLGWLPALSGFAVGQETIRLGFPREINDTLPRVLNAVGTRFAEGDGPKSSPAAAPGSEQPKMMELPLQILPGNGASGYMEHMVVPDQELVLTAGVPRLIILKQNLERAQIGGGDERTSPAVCDIVSKRELSILGRRTGRTVLNLWFADPYVSGRIHVVSYDVKIEPDLRSYRELEKLVKDTFPRSRVELKVVGNNLLVMGQARNAAEAVKIMRVFRPDPDVPPRFQPVSADPLHGHYAERANEPRTPLNVVNLLKVEPEDQVLLKVVVTEVNRTAVGNLGLEVPVDKSLPTLLTSTQLADAVVNLTKKKLARPLYETTMVAGSGQAAKLQDGGSFPVPAQRDAPSGSVQYVPFGVSMVFVPTVSDHDEIKLNMEGEVTTRDFSTRMKVRGTFLPSLLKRTFRSTVDVREGQTLAVAGVTHNTTTVVRERTFLGRMPLIGGLFGDNVVGDEQELIILVTPQLMHPSPPAVVAGAPVFERLPSQR